MNTHRFPFLAVILSSLLLLAGCNQQQGGSTSLNPAPQEPDTLSMTEEQVDKRIEEEAARQRGTTDEKLMQEAISAVQETRNAIAALDKNEKDNALAALERAVGKLEVLLARSPSLALAPVDIDVTVTDVVADIDAIRTLRKQAEDLLEDGNVQAARAMLQGAASEINISTLNLPLQTYPDAIRVAVRLLEENKNAEAKDALNAVLNTLVVTEESIPLPIIRAEAMLEETSKLLEDTKEESRQKALNLVANAEYQLKFAEELGYGDWDKEYGDIQRKLQEIEDKIEGKETATSQLKTLRDQIERFKDRIL